MTNRSVVSTILLLLVGTTSFAQTFRRQDSAVGGLAGAVIGGIIGHQNDETPEGALIGGAVGAIAGGLLGEAKDQQVARNRYYRQEVYRQQHQRRTHAVLISDVIRMSRSGISSHVIINHIRQHGVAQPVGANEVISLHENGVHENIIAELQRTARVREPIAVPTVSVPRPIVVHEEYHVPAPVHHHYVPAVPRVRYSTRPAYPRYSSRIHFHSFW